MLCSAAFADDDQRELSLDSRVPEAQLNPQHRFERSYGMKIGKALLLALGLSAVGTAALADWHGGYYHNHRHYHHRYSCHHHWCYR
jgi:hypothetical protein